MFNRIIDSGIYPNIFKNAKVSPIIFSLLRFSIQEVKNMLKVFAISISRGHPIICVPQLPDIA
jgi:hypothetical protein